MLYTDFENGTLQWFLRRTPRNSCEARCEFFIVAFPCQCQAGIFPDTLLHILNLTRKSRSVRVSPSLSQRLLPCELKQSNSNTNCRVNFFSRLVCWSAVRKPAASKQSSAKGKLHYLNTGPGFIALAYALINI